MPLPITSATTAAIALLLLFLAVLTVRHRLRLKAAFGDGEDLALIAASRSHGNLAEHAPIVLIMLGLLEYGEAHATILTVVAVAFVIGRICHAVGLHTPSEPGKSPIPRQLGVVLTWLTLFVLAAMLLIGVLAA